MTRPRARCHVPPAAAEMAPIAVSGRCMRARTLVQQADFALG
jgi:hypothetical protein